MILASLQLVTCLIFFLLLLFSYFIFIFFNTWTKTSWYRRQKERIIWSISLDIARTVKWQGKKLTKKCNRNGTVETENRQKQKEKPQRKENIYHFWIHQDFSIHQQVPGQLCDKYACNGRNSWFSCSMLFFFSLPWRTLLLWAACTLTR